MILPVLDSCPVSSIFAICGKFHIKKAVVFKCVPQSWAAVAEGVVKRTLLIGVIVALIVPSTVGSQETFTVSGVGAYPISGNLTSMWLVAPDKRPLVMAYFHGPDGWHNTQWKIASKFEKGKPGWAELRSDKATLRLAVNAETGETEVQTDTFKLSENNTFLVLHNGESSITQKVIPLGVFDLLASKDKPAPVMLIRANPALMERISKETAAH